MTTLPQTAPMRFPRPAVSSNLAPVGPAAHFGQPHAPVAPAAAGISLTGADVMRVLRANLWLLVIMLFAFGLAGFFFNKYLQKYHSRFTARGLLQVFGNDEIPVPGHPQPSANPAEIELVQRTQAQT